MKHKQLRSFVFAASYIGFSAIVICWLHFGWRSFDPTEVTWLLHGDLAQQLMGWLYYRNQPTSWSLPLGQLENYFFPEGSTLGYTDTAPWFAILLKTILPPSLMPLQTTGLWFYLGFFLQGIFAFLLLRRFGFRTREAAAAMFFFLTTEHLLSRGPHVSLTGQWPLLAQLLLYYQVQKTALSSKEACFWVLLQLILCATHPYLGVMGFAILGARILDLLRLRWQTHTDNKSMRKSWLILVAPFALALIGIVTSAAVFKLLGYFDVKGADSAGGFGGYSADGLAWINSRGVSGIFPKLPSAGGTYEGQAFLGAGLVLLLCISLGYWASQNSSAIIEGIRRHNQTPQAGGSLQGLIAILGKRLSPFLGLHGPVLLAAGAFGVFSLLPVVRIAGIKLFSIATLLAPFSYLTQTFRSNGRFHWPLTLWLIAIILVFAYKTLPRRAFLPLVFVLTWFQYFDRMPSVFGWNGFDPNPSVAALHSELSQISLMKSTVVTPVPYEMPTPLCGKEIYPLVDNFDIQFFAGMKGLRYTGGSLARSDPRAVEQKCSELDQALAHAALDADTIYVFHPVLYERFANRLKEHGNICAPVSARILCISADHMNSELITELKSR